MTGWPTPAPSEDAIPVAPQPVPPAEPPVIKRRLQRMVPRPVEEADAPTVTRAVLHGSRSTVKPQTRRDRQLVGTLPGWDPLPPGELLVSKPSTTP